MPIVCHCICFQLANTDFEAWFYYEFASGHSTNWPFWVADEASLGIWVEWSFVAETSFGKPSTGIHINTCIGSAEWWRSLGTTALLFYPISPLSENPTSLSWMNEWMNLPLSSPKERKKKIEHELDINWTLMMGCAGDGSSNGVCIWGWHECWDVSGIITPSFWWFSHHFLHLKVTHRGKGNSSINLPCGQLN